MEYSPRLKREADKHKVPAQTIVMADLMAIGYTESEAYNIAYSENAALTRQQNISIRENITQSIGFADLVKSRQRAAGRAETYEAHEPGSIMPQMTKDEVASQLRAQIELLPDGSKEKADVLMKYADLFSYKKEEKKGEDEEIIRIWMPLTCDICPFKKRYEAGE